jgi:small subunit ribosomal protein S9
VIERDQQDPGIEPEQTTAAPEPEQTAAAPEPEQTPAAPEPEPAAEAPSSPPAEQPAAEETPPGEAPAEEAPSAEAPADGEAPAEPEQVRRLAELAAGARYFATGKRKSSVARVIVRPGSGQFNLNGRVLEDYFPRRTHQAVVRQPLDVAGYGDRVDVRARIHGGGISGQADAVRHGIAKALIEADPALRGELKRRQFLTRDPRVKERKKAGLKKARKRPQFSKR